MKNILAVIAHPDDLELMAGGTIIKWKYEGKNIHVLTLTDGAWKSPQNTFIRSASEVKNEEKAVAEFVGYTYENLNCKTLKLSFSDDLVVEILKRIEENQVDTLIIPNINDLHHDHEVTARVAISASRRVPNILCGQINYYLREFFKPNVFIDISKTWEKKIEALKLYKGQWARVGHEWFEFLDVTSRYYGKIIGVERAEGFYSPKYKL